MEGEGVDTIIEGLKFIVGSKNLKVPDEIIFQEACSIYRGQMASKKYSGGGASSPFKNKTSFLSPPPSETKKPSKKQLDYLHANAINYDEKTINSKTAWKLIKEHKEAGVDTI